MADQCIQHLLQEHRAAEAVLAALDELLDVLQADHCWSAHRANSFARVRLFVTRDLPLHERKEDDILFPALAGFLPSDTGPLEVLRGEFTAIAAESTRMLDCAKSLVQAGASPQLVDNFLRAGRAFGQLLRDHIYKEDRILFPMVARYLPPEKDAELLAAMQHCATPGKGT
ncbi:MAG: hemerythrin domain-containing protein [Acidobacteria bacterium]|nr:hemerythrin domain-containing protein [Acidobacteriota bacterium]MCL5287619.1 hemerythrin domain-containing protein [Acidobacteriota bacterium]